MEKSKLLEMNNVGIVVENLDKTISFFTDIFFFTNF
jgi:catechol 2,3-dioxygenase-like lactoylglutathione lyase family enzyme